MSLLASPQQQQQQQQQEKHDPQQHQPGTQATIAPAAAAVDTSSGGDVLLSGWPSFCDGADDDDHLGLLPDLPEPVSVDALIARCLAPLHNSDEDGHRHKQQQPQATDSSAQQQAAAALQELCRHDLPPSFILGCPAWPRLAAALPALLLTDSASSDDDGGLLVAAAAQQLLLEQLAPELLHSNPEPLAQVLAALLAGPGPAAAAAAGGGSRCYTAAVLRVVVTGLQKLGRQWHFLEAPLAAQLCSSAVAALLPPIAASAHDTELGVLQEQQQQQQQQQHPLAVQLLLHDPRCSWWHRLNAASASAQPLRAAAQQQGLVRVLLQWLDRQQQQQEQAPMLWTPCQCSSSSSRSRQLLSHCLAVHVLAAYAGAHSGRQQLLQEATAGGFQGGSTAAGVLQAVLGCLRSWAARAGPAAELRAESKVGVQPPVLPQAAAAGSGAAQAAAVSEQAALSTSDGDTAAAVADAVAAAAEAAQLAVQAYEAQLPWFGGADE